jgi:hypothetical protein
MRGNGRHRHGSRPRIALALRIAASGGRYGRSTTVMMRRPSRGRDLSRSRRADSADDPWVGAREAWLGELVAPLSGLTSPNSADRSRLAGAVNIRMMASRQGLHESRGNGPPWLSGRIPGCRAGLAGCEAEMLWSAFRPVSVRATARPVPMRVIQPEPGDGCTWRRRRCLPGKGGVRSSRDTNG